MLRSLRRYWMAAPKPNKKAKGGTTALMTAASGGHSKVVKALLDGGAKPSEAASVGGDECWLC